MPELKETKKIKVVAQFGPDPNPQNSLLCTKSKRLPLDQIKQKARIEGDIENICCSAT